MDYIQKIYDVHCGNWFDPCVVCVRVWELGNVFTKQTKAVSLLLLMPVLVLSASHLSAPLSH